MVQIRLFGGVSATDDSGTPLDIGPAKCLTVLAALALSVGSAVPVARLVDLVWDSEPPRTAEKTLQSYVVQLRKCLGQHTIVRSGAAYRLDVGPEAVDVNRFRRLLESGDTARALKEWTGIPLTGLAGHGLAPVIDGLVELWIGATETDLERRLETDPLGAVAELTELTANHPFREGFWSLLMTALYRVGRQADALAAFQQIRRNLVDQLGVEPGAHLQDLESRILEHDDRLGAPVTTVKPHPSGTVTFGFCEVAGVAQLWVTQPIKTAAAMVRLDELVRAAVDRQGGQVFAASGESFGAAFHRADDAAAWATQLQLEISREPWPGGIELRLRVGLHTGETQQTAHSFFGPAVNTAAGIAAAADGGQTLLSDVTSSLLERTDLLEQGRYRPADGQTTYRILQLGPGQHPPLQWRDGPPGNLPARLGHIVGRDKDLELVAASLARFPMVTLCGPGGIGKTRLALAAAQQMGTSQNCEAWFIDLAAIGSSSDVARAVADTLGVSETPGRSLTQAIVAWLQARRVLLILDNCEQVIDGAAAIATQIVGQCLDATVLATSREALGLDSEQLFEVLPLDPALSGADLFIERAQAVSREFNPAPHRADIEEICRRLDGIPLAIELAAARSRTLTPADLTARLGDRLRLLTGGRRTSAVRHHTLRATMQWSYDLLTPPQQDLFQRLSLFAGTFDLGGAAYIVVNPGTNEPENDPEATLADLVARSMVIVESGPFGQRFRLLETMREFAAGLLGLDGGHDEIARRHTQWCLDQVTRLHQLLVGPREVEGVDRLAQLWPNLRAAFDRACQDGDHVQADALVRPLVAEVNLRKQTEITEWAERILAITPSDSEAQIAFWLLCACHRYKQNADHGSYDRLASRYGTFTHPVVRYTRAYLADDAEKLRDSAADTVSWLRRQGEDNVANHVEIGGVASGLMSSGRFAELDTLVTTLAARYRSDGPPTLLYVTLTMLGYSAFFQGQTDRAESLFDEAALVDVPERTISVNKPIEARAAFRRGKTEQAFRILRTHIDELLATDHHDLAAATAIEFINMMAALDRLPAAEPVLRYLEITGDFGALAARTLVADAAQRIAHGLRRSVTEDSDRLDAHHTLTYMRDVLTGLLAEPFASLERSH